MFARGKWSASFCQDGEQTLTHVDSKERVLHILAFNQTACEQRAGKLEDAGTSQLRFDSRVKCASVHVKGAQTEPHFIYSGFVRAHGKRLIAQRQRAAQLFTHDNKLPSPPFPCLRQSWGGGGVIKPDRLQTRLQKSIMKPDPGDERPSTEEHIWHWDSMTSPFWFLSIPLCLCPICPFFTP